MQKPTPAKIDTMVWELFRKRIRDGQLDEAELTFGELAKIRESFVMTLSTMLHGRIAYPKDEEFDEDEDDQQDFGLGYDDSSEEGEDEEMSFDDDEDYEDES